MTALEESNLVFVYGTLKQGYGNHRLLTEAEKLGTAIVQDVTLYDMGFPVAIDSDGDFVTGEVYRVDDEETMQRLDWLEGYPSFYDRKLVDTEHGQAWMYFQTEVNNLRHIGDTWPSN